MKNKNLFLVLITISLLSACVPARKYEELKAKQKACTEENAALKTQVQTLEEQNNEMTTTMSSCCLAATT